MREKRKYRRLRYCFDIKCQNKNKTLFTAKCVDMSSGGIRIISDRNINTGDTLDMELNFDGRFLPLKVKGKDMWQRPFVDRGAIQFPSPEFHGGSGRRPKMGAVSLGGAPDGQDKIETGIQFLDIDSLSKNRIYNFITNFERERLAKTKELHAEIDMPF